MTWRRLRPGEMNHEFIWLFVTLGSAVFAWMWLHFGLYLPQCLFHDLTGVACPTCGATRCVRCLTRGAWVAAFLMNPMVFTTLLAVTLYDIYAAIVLSFRLPRLRFDEVSSRMGNLARYGFLAVLLVNWMWLIFSGV